LGGGLVHDVVLRSIILINCLGLFRSERGVDSSEFRVVFGVGIYLGTFGFLIGSTLKQLPLPKVI
jgi:hypothetical protein